MHHDPVITWTGLIPGLNHLPEHVGNAILISVIIVIMVLVGTAKIRKSDPDDLIIPSGQFTLQNFLETMVEAILKLIGEHQSDYVLEPAESALIAIGPPVIAPAGARLGHDYVYDIYVGSTLGEIPTKASAEALMRYIASKKVLEEYEAEDLAALGHPDAIPFLRDYYTPGDHLVATVLHKLALVNDYTGPERIEWWAVALNDYADFVRVSTGKQPTWLPVPEPAPPGSDRERATDDKTHEKKQRDKARAQRRRQRKKKKKKRRR